MSYIKFTYDTDANTWLCDATNIQFDRNELQFYFVSDEDRTRFKNLNFSYAVKHNDEVVDTGNYPPAGIEYQYADSSSALAISAFSFAPDKKYFVTVNVNNSGKSREDTFEIVGIRPPKPPFESWTFDSNKWVAPIPMPVDGIYEWHESLQRWNKVTDLSSLPDNESIRPDDNNP